MNDNESGSWETWREERAVCSLLGHNPEKYVNNLPYNVQEADFTWEECRTVFRTVHMFHDKGEPFDFMDVFVYLQRRAGTGDCPECRILLGQTEENKMDYSARAVRMAALRRRLRENAYPDEASRLAEQQELYAILEEVEAIQRKLAQEEEERQRQLQVLEAIRQTKKQASSGKPEEHPLLPILKKMVQQYLMGEHSGTYWTHAEVLAFFRQELGFALIESAQGLPKLLPEAFREYLAEHEGIVIQLHQVGRRQRGIRLQPVLRKRTPEELKYTMTFVPQQLTPGVTTVNDRSDG